MTILALWPILYSHIFQFAPFNANKCVIRYQLVFEDKISRLQTLLVLFFSNGIAKTKLAILAFLCYRDLWKTLIQECLFCQFRHSCTIRNELEQWSLQPWNINLLAHWYLIYTNIIWCKGRRELEIYMRMQSSNFVFVKLPSFPAISRKLVILVLKAFENFAEALLLLSLIKSFTPTSVDWSHLDSSDRDSSIYIAVYLGINAEEVNIWVIY